MRLQKIDSITKEELTEDKCQRIYQELESIYKRNLSDYGVKFPDFRTVGATHLIVLYKYRYNYVSSTVLGKACEIRGVGEATSITGRDLKKRGFNILGSKDYLLGEPVPRGYYILTDITEPNPGFRRASEARSKLMDATSWEKKKEVYGHCCATCGAAEGMPHKVTHKTVVLQKGHMDPTKPMTEDNIIPQCEYCNENAYQDKFIFDEHGYPVGLASADIVLTAKTPKHVQGMILTRLLDKRNKRGNDA